MFDVPVVMIVFRRLDLVKKVFESVRELKPMHLYIISDGPRNTEEGKEVQAVRDYIDSNIDWDCTVHRNYSDVNLGLRYRMPTGTDWVFETADRAIFLEDDICPSQSFFWYCKEMLEKYEDDPHIMMVSGNNIFPDADVFGDYDITFGYFSITWGWATWRRAWSKFDVNISAWKNPESKKILKERLIDKAYRFFVNTYDDLQYQWRDDAWDYQWELAMMLSDGLGVIPRKNLIDNLGMGTEGAEHADDDESKVNLVAGTKAAEMKLPVRCPEAVTRNIKYDEMFQEAFYPETSLIKYLKYVYRAYLNKKSRDIISELENDEYYYNNILEDKYKLSEFEKRMRVTDTYKQISGKELRDSARKYKKYLRSK